MASVVYTVYCLGIIDQSMCFVLLLAAQTFVILQHCRGVKSVNIFTCVFYVRVCMSTDKTMSKYAITSKSSALKVHYVKPVFL